MREVELHKDAELSISSSLETEEEESENTGSVSYSQLFRFATFKERCLIAVATLGAMVHGSTLPAFGIIFGSLTQDLGQTGDDSCPECVEEALDKVTGHSVKFLLLGAAGFCGAFFSLSVFMWTAEKQIQRIRQEYMKSVLSQEVAWFDLKSQGELSTKLSAQTVLVQQGIGEKLAVFIQHMTGFTLGIGGGFYYSWQVTLVVLASIPIMGAVMSFATKVQTTLDSEIMAKYELAGQRAEEAISGIRTVTAFSGQEKELKEYAPKLDVTVKAGIRMNTLNGAAMGVSNFLVFAMFGVALWYGAKLIRDGTTAPTFDRPYDGGIIMTVVLMVLTGGFEAGYAGPSVPAFISAKTAGYALFQIIDRKSLIDPLDATNGKKIKKLKGDISLKNITFRYPSRPELTVFDGISLKIRSGQTVAFVGPSGSGKSTAIQLIERFYDPLEGQVLVDGFDLKKLNVKWWRSQVGLVSQEPILFHTTIAENIRFGKPDATMDDIVAAAKAANAHSFIKKFPAGYDTDVGEDGHTMSGGQKQRIAIARAIIKDPKILLLDEATSALDNESEKVVQQALDRAMQGRTTVIVAHRLSTIRHADRIFVLDHGVLRESGTHTELLQKKSVYYHLVEAQEQQAKQQEETIELQRRLSEASSKEDTKAISLSLLKHSLAQSTTRRPREDEEGDTKKKNKKSNKELQDEADEAVAEKVKWDVPSVSLSDVWAKYPKYSSFYLVLGSIGAILNGALFPMFSVFFSKMMLVFFEPDPEKMKEDSLLIMVGFGAVGVVLMIGCFLMGWGFSVPGQRLTKILRVDGLRSIFRQEIGFFDEEQNNSKVLAARLSVDTTLVQVMVSQSLAALLKTVALLAAGIIIAFVSSWKLAFVMLALIPILGGMSVVYMKIATGFNTKGKEQFARSARYSAQAFDNIRTVASFTAEQRVLSGFSDSLVIPLQLAKRTGLVSGVSLGLSSFVENGSYALCFWIGAELVRNGSNTFEEMNTCIFAIVMAAFGLGEVQSMLPSVSRAKEAKDNIFFLLNRVSKMDPFSSEGQTSDVAPCGRLQFDNVRFRYPTRQDMPVLKGVSFTVEPGESVALVGESGSGKSTIIQLLLKFYEKESGSITIDGVEIGDLNTETLRQHMGLVQQEPILFDCTIRENILRGKADATEEEVIQAARDANIHDVVMEQPLAYDTVCGPKGSKLSGGQKQRVAIARALVRQPRILLLDEATSALDSESEKIIQQALDELLQDKQRTTIMIAHRLSTVRNCDKIVVMDRGEVVEMGSHVQLMTRNGVYAALVRAGTGEA